jgi:ketosteroid isomerase-like protein
VRLTLSRRRDTLVGAATFAVLAAAGCGSGDSTSLTAAERSAIADTLTRLVDQAWDFKRGDVVNHLMSLYPATGPVLSAASGHITTSRDTLRQEIQTFWTYVGQNMRDPHFERIQTKVDVLDRNAAVLTTTYHIPHIQPNGMPHDLGGAMTLVFQRRDGKWSVIQEHLSDVPQLATAPMSMPMDSTTSKR